MAIASKKFLLLYSNSVLFETHDKLCENIKNNNLTLIFNEISIFTKPPPLFCFHPLSLVNF